MATQKVKIGKFTQDQYGIFRGNISGLGIGSTEVISQEVSDREGKLYQKLIADPLGAAYEVGAAFPRNKGDMAYYSVNLESPLFPASLSAALFPDRENMGTFNLVWERPEAPKPSADAAGKPQGRRPTQPGTMPNA